jgi:hypothetical protein
MQPSKQNVAKESDMETITMPVNHASTNFSEARRQAICKANEMLTEPVIIAWKDDQTRKYGPEIPGGSSDRWHEYADSHEGKLELKIGDAFHFIFLEAADFEEPDLNLTSISEKDGATFLCLNNACTEEDLKNIGYFSGGGMGD